jgi:hypothetical protein
MVGRPSRGIATLPVCVVVGLLATALVLGAGHREARTAVVDGVTWLLSRDGDDVRLTRARGSSGAAERRTFIEGVDGEVEIIQRDGVVYVRMGDTVRRLDDGLAAIEAGTAVPAGQRLVVGDGAVWVVDGEAGAAWVADPQTLARRGATVEIPEGATSAVYGLDERLWVASPRTGELIGVVDGASGATVDRSLDVGGAGPTEVLLRDGMPMVVSAAASAVIAVRDGGLADRLTLPSRIGSDGLVVAEAARGDLIPVLDPGLGTLHLASPGAPVSVDLPSSDGYGPPVGYAGRAYVPDRARAVVLAVSAAGQILDEIGVPGARPGSEFELRLDGGHLWINDPASRTALVVGPDGETRTVDKYDPEAQGPAPGPTDDAGPDADPPPTPPGADVPEAPPSVAPVPPTPAPTAPPPTAPPLVPTEPSAPTITAAAPSNRSVSVSWQVGPDGGAPIDDVEVAWTSEEGEDSETVDAGTSTVEVGDLRNGVTYTFTVRARNTVGWSPASAPKTARPSNQVPDAPTAVSATQDRADNADGSVRVDWDEPDGQGFDIGAYQVYAIDATTSGTALVADDVPASSCGGGRCGVTVPTQPGWLGVPQRFAVVADSSGAGGAASEQSEPSDEVVPATPPDAPGELELVSSSADGRTLELRAAVGFDGGHDLTGVTVLVDQVPTEADPSACASATDRSLQCTVTAQVPDRTGEHAVALEVATDMGAATSPAAAIGAKAAPTASISASAPAHNTARVTWSAGGDDVTCRVTGPNLDRSECSGSLDVPGVPAGLATYTIVVTSPYHPPASQSASTGISNPPPPPVVTVSRGAPKTVSGCSSSQCAWVVVRVENMGGPYRVDCYSDMQAAPYYSYNTTSTSSQVCVFGYNGHRVWAVVNGVRSADIRW